MTQPSPDPADVDAHVDADGVVHERRFEIGVAVLLVALAVLVIVDSVRVGIGWADDGPRSGYFPFWIGLFLFAAGAAILFGQLRRTRSESPAFAGREQLRRVGSVFVPMVAYVAGVGLVGLYVASFALILYFMTRHGRYRLPASLAVSGGVPLCFFLVFERWFLVQLPKGPLEQLLGF
jgi:putative tricarboxylic transport membrane protein